MDRRSVHSSIIKSVGWQRGLLEVEFRRTGAIYRYYDVGIDLYRGMLTADSVGSYFKTEIEPHVERERIK